MLREVAVLGSGSGLVRLSVDWESYSCFLRFAVDGRLREASDALLAYLLKLHYALS